jgi:hypothetical protein
VATNNVPVGDDDVQPIEPRSESISVTPARRPNLIPILSPCLPQPRTDTAEEDAN